MLKENKMKGNKYLLPKEIKPLNYKLEIEPNFKNFKFKGNEEILIKVLKKTKKIVLNSKRLKITKVLVNQSKTFSPYKINYNKELQTVQFLFKNNIKKGVARLSLSFEGELNNDMRGFYRSSYGKNKIMVSTQFEPNDARKCFPCFDEPDLKATFDVSLIIPKKLEAVSNMPIKNELITNNTKKISFKTTPLMSTYLLAFSVGEFELIKTRTKQGTLIRVITTPGKKHQGKFALNLAKEIVEFYNNYFKIKYPLPKLDLIAIPEFEAGAMENWGLITYRETALLFDEESSSAAVKQRISVVIAHEIAHQWFGNLVTMKWWNDLWLNEGFASWMEYKPIDYLFPEWDMWTQFFNEATTTALYLDGLKSSHPIEVDVYNPDNLGEIFDAISYDKGAAIIRMLEQYLGEETFRRGLQHYIKTHLYDNAKTEDLWVSLEKISKKPVKKIMNTWTKQAGYPLVSVSIEKNKLKIKKERFTYLRNKRDKASWIIPFALSKNNKKKYSLLSKKEEKVNLSEIPTKFNESQTGFYRVCYDKGLFENLVKELNNDKLKIIDKLGVENDIFALSRGCYIKLTDFLEIIKYYKKEIDYTIWDDISVNMTKIKSLFQNNQTNERLDLFVKNLFEDILNKVGWDEKKGEKHKDSLLRAVVLSSSGLSGNKEVLEEAKKRFSIFIKSKKLNPNIRTLVYSLVALQGDKKDYEIIKELYKETKLQEEKIRFLKALCTFKQQEILKETLRFILSKEVRVQDVSSGMAFVAGNPYGKDLAWDFFKLKYKEFYKRYEGSAHTLSNIIKSICSQFSSLEKLKEIETFFKKHQAKGIKQAIGNSLEAIEINYNFVKNNEKELKEWLYNN
ncbi:MAG: M1 family metallopeptidase [Candidatus Woesearchaeota archaeon]|nr:MAG: M1 family metallopeptidase [Candidatus Woesearchaeota archaeon]